jgi:hypothetical protein
VSLEQEIRDILRELVEHTGALSAATGPEGVRLEEIEDIVDARVYRAPFGHGDEVAAATEGEVPPEVAAVILRAARSLGLCVRRHGQVHTPSVEVPRPQPRSLAAARRRCQRFLGGFAASQRGCVACLLHRGELVATAGALDDERRARLELLRHRVDADAARLRGVSSHGEVLGDDVFARSFGYTGHIVAFFESPFSVDFVRHRARCLARELAPLLPMLDGGPTLPADVMPRPRPEEC